MALILPWINFSRLAVEAESDGPTIFHNLEWPNQASNWRRALWFTAIHITNPLAEPSTLGILSGAQLAITLMTLWAVTVSAFQRDIAALVGGLAAVAIVSGLTRKTGFAPMTLLLCGLVISFSAGSASVILALFHHEYLRGMFIWGSGSLIQNDYANAIALAVRLIIFVPVLLLFQRPLAIAGLDDANSHSFGLSLTRMRALV